jgi:hypothetical protein
MEKMCFQTILADFSQNSLFSKENYGWRKSIAREHDNQKDDGKNI